MTCEVCQSACYDLLDRSLCVSDERRVLEHIEKCPHCKAFLEEEGRKMRTWPRLLGVATQNSVMPRDAAERVAHALEVSHGRAVRQSLKGGWVRLSRQYPQWAALAASLLVVTGIGIIGIDSAARQGQDIVLMARDSRGGKVKRGGLSADSPVTVMETQGVQGLTLPVKLPGVLTLSKGLAKVGLPSGVELALQGPLELRVESGMEVRLASGRLLAWVPPRASGFTVHAQGLTARDIGTVFAVAADNGRSGFLVFKGTVQIQGDADAEADFCGAGEGALAVAGGGPVKFAADVPEVRALSALNRGYAAMEQPEKALAAADRTYAAWAPRYSPPVARAAQPADESILENEGNSDNTGESDMNKTTGSLILSAALAATGTLADTPTTWYVATNGNDSAAGTGWDTAFRTIAKGVSSATGVRDTVIVSNGTYLVTAPVSVDRAITLCGLSPNPRDTVIDGGGTTYCLSLSASNAVACGITVSNGYATIDGGGARVSNGAVLSNSVVTCCRLIAANWWYTGGGIAVSGRGTVFADCEVSYNYVTNGYGGGVGMNNLATMTNCLVVGNQCVEGYNGGVYMTDGSTAVDCTIRDNAGKYGGGIGRGGTIRRCLIAGNRSLVSQWDGGGGGVYARSKTVIEDCVITNNTSAGMGGGIAVGEIGSFTWIRNCLIAGNAAPKGGGVSYPDQAPSSFFSLTDCVIRDNTATNTYGGGVWFGCNSTCPSNVIRNCLFAGNSSKTQGGGLYLKGSNLTLTACTVVGNTAGSEGGGGLVNGKVWPLNNSAITVSNCLFFGNNATGSSYSNLLVEVKADTNLFFHSFEPGGMLPGAKGNVSGDPMFENYVAGDYRLAQGSPCCNAGATEPWMLKADAVDLGTEPAVVPTATYGVHLDFGNKRRVCGPDVDIGAYERYYLSGTMIRLQ